MADNLLQVVILRPTCIKEGRLCPFRLSGRCCHGGHEGNECPEESFEKYMKEKTKKVVNEVGVGFLAKAI